MEETRLSEKERKLNQIYSKRNGLARHHREKRRPSSASTSNVSGHP
jgi:hypothetical protein